MAGHRVITAATTVAMLVTLVLATLAVPVARAVRAMVESAVDGDEVRVRDARGDAVTLDARHNRPALQTAPGVTPYVGNLVLTHGVGRCELGTTCGPWTVGGGVYSAGILILRGTSSVTGNAQDDCVGTTACPP